MDPIIFDDATKNATQEHEQCLWNVIDKMYHFFSSEDHARIKLHIQLVYCKFWSKIGVFSDKSIWLCEYAQKGESYKWHQEFSFKEDQFFGFVACRVTSKTLGIGSCERSWGKVDFVSGQQRFNLNPELRSKQAILYGDNCMKNSREPLFVEECVHWGDDDLDDNELNDELI